MSKKTKTGNIYRTSEVLTLVRNGVHTVDVVRDLNMIARFKRATTGLNNWLNDAFVEISLPVDLTGAEKDVEKLHRAVTVISDALRLHTFKTHDKLVVIERDM